MNTASTAQADAPVGAAASVDSPEPLHPREWAMLQTSLTGAQRDALLVVVSAYTGFQLRNGQFYIVESRVAPYLRTTFSTFRNYLTALHELGLLEMLSRSPNQHGPKSVWRMSLDVIRSNGQMVLPLEQTVENRTPEEQTGDVRTVVAEVAVEELEDPIELDSGVQDGGELNDVDEEIVVVTVKSLRDMQAEISSLRRRVRTLDKRVQVLDGRQGGLQGNRAARREATRKERKRGGNEKKENRAGPAVSKPSKLVSAVNGLLVNNFGLTPLTKVEVRRVLEMEADWLRRFPDEDMPDYYSLYAAEQAAEKAERDFTAYMLKVLADSLERGYTERGIPDTETSQRFLEKQGRWPKKESRY